MGESETQKLQLDTMEALHGAEHVRKRLLVEMSSGTPSILDLAYAVKVRIKEDYRIVEKVIRKREGDKPDYTVDHLRDIVGLRIVTLYRLDALQILPILLERSESGKSSTNNVFGPRGIEEIIIYSTNPTGDAQDLPGRTAALCRAFNLECKIEQTPQNYTSIHIVVWCRGTYRGSYRDVPVEIQIRTAFEDVWGEIDHSLKYKKQVDLGDPELAARVELNKSHLSVMKTLIDGLAQYGDQIKLQMEGDARIRASEVRHSEQALDHLAKIEGLSDPAKRLVEAAVTEAQRSLDQSLEPVARTIAQRQAAAGLIRAAELVQEMHLADAQLIELNYLLEMERAFLLFELGNQLGGVTGNSALVEASRIYGAMAAQFPERVVPLYRLARTYDELGDRPAALNQYQAAVDAIEGSELAPKHWLRSAAPRLLGFAHWEAAVEQLHTKTDAEARAHALKQILDAIDLTLLAVAEADPESREHVRSCNNLLYYVLEYRKHGGDAGELVRRALGDGEVSKLLQQVTELAADDISNWDTIREANLMLYDDERALGAAKKVLELLQEPHRGDRYTRLESMARRNAEETIAILTLKRDERGEPPKPT